MSEMDSTKRKAEGTPEGELPPRRRNSMPDFTQVDLFSRSHTLPELLKSTFQDPKLFGEIAPSLALMMKPIIDTAIGSAVDQIVKKLNDTVVTPIITKYEEKINDLQAHIQSQDSRIIKLENRVNDLEQYGRRNSIKIANLNAKSIPKGDTDEYVVQLINEMVRPEVKIKVEDIERSHPVGMTNSKGKKQVLVKFKCYKTKSMVYNAKRNLKGNPGKVFISEDLTRENYDLIKKLYQMKSDNRINSFWTIDCKIYMKLSEHGRSRRIISAADIDSIPTAVFDSVQLGVSDSTSTETDSASSQGPETM